MSTGADVGHTPLSAEALELRSQAAPRQGWRAAWFRITGHNLGLSPVEDHRRALEARIRAPLVGPYSIAVASINGGIGKTTVSALLGLMLAEYRGDRAIAIDANPDAGTLAARLVRESLVELTIRDLLDDIDTVRSSTDLSAYTYLAGRLQVLASEQEPALSERFGHAEYGAVLRVLGQVIRSRGTRGSSRPAAVAPLEAGCSCQGMSEQLSVLISRHLISRRGWAGTTVRDVARAAEVAEPTVYATYRNKAGLAHALIDAGASAADIDRQAAELAVADGDPSGQLAAMIAFDRRLYEHGGTVLAVLRDAGRSEPELAEAYAAGRAAADTLRRSVVGAWPPGTLQAGLELDDAVDTYAALCNIDLYRILTGERGWSPDRVEHWLHTTVCRLLFD